MAKKETITNSTLGDFKSAVEDVASRGTAQSYYQTTNGEYLTLNETLLLNLWNKKGLIRTFVCLPVDDALKDGVEISADNMDDEACKKLEDIFKVKGEPSVKESAYWARHFGGGGLIVLTDQELKEPFNKEKLNQTVSFMAVDRWRLPATAGYTDDFVEVTFSQNAFCLDLGVKSANHNKKTKYKNKYKPDSKNDIMSQVNGKPVDKSRITIMMGDSAPIITRQALSGWGLSVYEKIAEDCDTYEVAMVLLHELMEEGKTNVIKVDGLLNSLRAKKFGEIIKVFTTMSSMKKKTRTMLLDGKDDYQQTQSNLSGYSEAIKSVMIRLAAGLRMPLTKIFGISAAGFNSGEDDIENYNSMINSTIRPKMRPMIQEVLEILCASELGIIPKNLQFKYRPLREINPETEEKIKSSKLARLVSLLDSEQITDEEFKEKVERYGLA